MKKGTLYGVGLGPGDPELITLKAARILNECEHVFFPRRSEKDKGVSVSILAGIMDTGSKKLHPLVFPMVTDHTALRMAWATAAKSIYSLLETGEDAVFITEGDPLMFSTFFYILAHFQSEYPDINVQVVPGITSAVAAAAAGKICIGKGAGSVEIIPASSNLEKIRLKLQADQNFQPSTLILLKIRAVIKELADLIESKNLPFFFVEKCSMPDELIITDIHKLKLHKPDYFSLMVINPG